MLIIAPLSNKAKAKKNAGHDDISTFYLKKLSTVVYYPVSKLVNMSIGTGAVPNSMKVYLNKKNVMILQITDQSRCCRLCQSS